MPTKHDNHFANIGSVFYPKQMLVFGYYDGPTEGIVVCPICQNQFLFKMLDWDSGQDTRIFVLSQMPLGSLEALTDIISPLIVPKWPIWVPEWKFASLDDEKSVRLKEKQILDQANLPDSVIAWCDEAGGFRIMAYRFFEDITDLKNVSDWFAFLDLNRQTDKE